MAEAGPVGRLQPPKRAATVDDLMLHTSGLCCECFSPDDPKYRTATGIPTVVSSSFDSIRTVLLHEPGAARTDGVNIDCLGRIVEQQRGKRLGEVMRERIFDLLAMHDIGFSMSEQTKSTGMPLHDGAGPHGRWTSSIPSLSTTGEFADVGRAGALLQPGRPAKRHLW